MNLFAVGSLYIQEGPVLAGGCVAEVGRAARGSDIRAVAASRIGFDQGGRDLVDALRGEGMLVDAIQVDSDLPTPRRVVRGVNVRLEPYAAFDNLQFDSDIEAYARVAEAVITDACSRRHGQGRSAIDRVFTTAVNAVRVVDLVRRTPPEDRLDRECVGNALELAHLFVVDAVAIRALIPAVADPVAALGRFVALDRKRCAVALLDGRVIVAGTEQAELGAIPIGRSAFVAVTCAKALVFGSSVAAALATLTAS